ncbi:hypothetical protein SASPL_135568 [Salvia splendens]|uniref:Small subunit ribosomal protein S23e n=1 Tax=Salvia splendens TaxID=180675 RepID=A0A8X8X0G2_SALSN|nr:hypothetical protein SASPL_135568 [Salvia splendens]
MMHPSVPRGKATPNTEARLSLHEMVHKPRCTLSRQRGVVDTEMDLHANAGSEAEGPSNTRGALGHGRHMEVDPTTMGKTRGMGAGLKLKSHRRTQRWADKLYKKSHLGNEWKKPFSVSSHAKGIVLEKIGIEAKQPNFAIRKCARVHLIKNGKKIAAFGHAVGDIPGVRFKVVKVSGISLLALFKEKKEKPRS